MGKSLGEFEQILLFTILSLGADAYGVGIQDAIQEATGRRRSAGSIHTTLERLERRGFVTSLMGDPTPVRGGRRRRYYTLSPAGARALKRSYDDLQRVAAGVLGQLEQLAGES